MATEAEVSENSKASLKDLMPSIVGNIPTWADMMDVFDRVVYVNVEGPISQLEKLRFIDDKTDDGILNSTARLLGFDLSQDVLNLNADNLTKIVSQLSLYPDQNGTRLFAKFIDLILNSLSQIEELWTKDYVNFFTAPEGPTIKEGGPWFKTTHINLNIALLSLDTLVLDPGVTLYQRVQNLFLTLSPVAIVIKRMDFVILFEDKDWLGGAALGLGSYMQLDDVDVVVD